MNKKGSTGMWLVAIVAIVAIIGLVILYSSLSGKGKASATGEAYRPTVLCHDSDADGYTNCAGDCNDGNAAVHPGVFDSCNGIDDECDGIIDSRLGLNTCPTCTDSDGGDAIYTGGRTSDTSPQGAGAAVLDACLDSKTLKEYVCDPYYSGSRIGWRTHTCDVSCGPSPSRVGSSCYTIY